MDTASLVKQGYRRISRKFGGISRIDRPDWFDWMNKNFFYGELVYDEKPCWEDYYRRVHSKDKLELGTSMGLKIPVSCWDYTGYIDKK